MVPPGIAKGRMHDSTARAGNIMRRYLGWESRSKSDTTTAAGTGHSAFGPWLSHCDQLVLEGSSLISDEPMRPLVSSRTTKRTRVAW
jgi:hypothetical protein